MEIKIPINPNIFWEEKHSICFYVLRVECVNKTKLQ